MDADHEDFPSPRDFLGYVTLNKKATKPKERSPTSLSEGCSMMTLDSGLEFTPHIHRTLSP